LSENSRGAIGAAAVNLDELRERARRVVADARIGELTELEELAVGGASLTFRGVLEADNRQPVVLKLAPPGVPPVRNRDVLRQAHILKLLAAGTDIRAPRVLCEDPGQPVEIPPFFIMTLEPGECTEPILGPEPLPPPDEIRGRALHAAQMLADLHSLDPGVEGLEGEPRTSLVDEIDRWSSALATVDDDLRVGADEAEQGLRAAIPNQLPPVVLHGDYRLGNMLCHRDRVSAVIDWELWSIADPRLDLGWFRLHARASGNPYAIREAPGMPEPDMLADAYAAASGRELSDLRWFDAIVRFKQAAAAALIVKHARRREGPDARLPIAQAIPGQLADAARLLG
jgi:aminoglycoside phosphotransferase (APT) family kinase protein